MIRNFKETIKRIIKLIFYLLCGIIAFWGGLLAIYVVLSQWSEMELVYKVLSIIWALPLALIFIGLGIWLVKDVIRKAIISTKNE